jgi:hypothetical protein
VCNSLHIAATLEQVSDGQERVRSSPTLVPQMREMWDKPDGLKDPGLIADIDYF